MKKKLENSDKKMTIRINDEIDEKLKGICLATGKSKSSIAREFIQTGKIVLANKKEFAREMARYKNTLNNHALEINDSLRRTKESIDSLRYAVRECSVDIDKPTRKRLNSAMIEVEKVADDAESLFRSIKEDTEKGVNKIVDSYSGK